MANFPQIEGQIIHCIAKSYENFVIKHTQWNENFRHALVFNNQSLTTGLGNENLADGDFFAEFMNNYTDRVYRIKVSDIHQHGYVSRDDFERNTGIPISQIKLTALRGLYDTANTKYGGEARIGLDNTDLLTYVNRFKKGSRAFRRVFADKKLDTIPNNIARFAENTETIIGIELSELLNASWNINFLDNSMRTFVFKLHNTALPYNHVLAHFAENIEPYCSFFLLTRHENPERDTALHVFYSCPITERLLGTFFAWLLGDNRIVWRSEVFGVFNENNLNNNKILFIVTKIFQKYIWDCQIFFFFFFYFFFFFFASWAYCYIISSAGVVSGTPHPAV